MKGQSEFHDSSFMQRHGGREDFSSSGWRRTNEYRESDSSDFVDSSFSYVGIGPKGYQRSDERIYEDACETLCRNPTVDASNIEVRVEAGVVKLSGTAINRMEKKEAEHCLENIIGVIDIENKLKIVTQTDQVNL